MLIEIVLSEEYALVMALDLLRNCPYPRSPRTHTRYIQLLLRALYVLIILVVCNSQHCMLNTLRPKRNLLHTTTQA